MTFSYESTTEVHRDSTRIGKHKFVAVQITRTKGEVPYCAATLECTNSVRHFSIPVAAKHLVFDDNLEMILIEFIMDDRQTVRECTLTISLGADIRRATAYVLSLKDFVPDQEVSPGK